MRTPHRIALSFASLALVTTAIPLAAQPRGDGQHDFDFEHGRWHVHLARLVKPLSHSTTWTTLDGTSVVRPVWGGLANLGELEVDGAGTHIQGLSLRVYDPKARQWRIHWANSRDGVLGPAMVGGFSGGRGEFYDQEDFEGRPIFVRFVFSDIAARSFKIEQAFSDDGGKSWETNWITTFTKDADQTPPRSAPNATDAPRDFAFEVGTWTMHRRRLENPLGGPSGPNPMARRTSFTPSGAAAPRSESSCSPARRRSSPARCCTRTTHRRNDGGSTGSIAKVADWARR
jgi:hypothetical protein